MLQLQYLFTTMLIGSIVCLEVRISKQHEGYSFGRVEVFINATGSWGTICADEFTDATATVVCRQMGYKKGIKNQGFASNSIPVNLQKIDCYGNETVLEECWYNTSYPIDQTCTDASVFCFNSSGPNYRLVPGPLYGRLEIGFDDMWGTASRHGFNWIDARVVCRDMGFLDGMPYYGSSAYQTGTGLSMIYNPKCDGNEDSFRDCEIQQGFGSNIHGHNYDVSLYCSNSTPAVAILRGYFSRVEYWSDGTYSTRKPICDTDWDDTDATVLCKERGFDGGKAVLHGSIDPWHVSGALQSGFNCSGNEQYLLDCPHTTESCGASKGAGVVCYHDEWQNVSVALSHGHYGRVIVTYYKVRGLICDDDWTTKDAIAVCGMLGYSAGVGIRGGIMGYEGGHVPYWLKNVTCAEGTTSLWDCQYEAWGGFYPECKKNNPGGVSVVCYDQSSPYAYSVRLVNGASNYGRLEVYKYNIWGTVAATKEHSANVSNVACRELGYNYGEAFFGNPVGESTSTVWFQNIRCLGNETTLQDCSMDDLSESEQWTHQYDLFVLCFNDIDEEVTYSLRYTSFGGVLANYHGMVAPVCSVDWDDVDAEVLCKSLGHVTGMADVRTYQYNLPMVMSEVNCVGNETSLGQCKFTGHGNEVDHVACTVNSDFTPASAVCFDTDEHFYEYRLSNGGLCNGRLEMTVNEEWGTVCQHNFASHHADIICKQFGYDSGVVELEKYGKASGKFWLRVHGSCSADDLVSCTRFGIGTTHCTDHVDDVGVFCKTENDENICGRNYTTSSDYGRMRSPGHPNANYPISCSSYLSITVPEGFRVLLAFTGFQLESSSECSSDYVEVTDVPYLEWDNTDQNTVLGRYCGDSIPSNIYSTGRGMVVHFNSDSANVFTGFAAHFEKDCETGIIWRLARNTTILSGNNFLIRAVDTPEECQTLCEGQPFCHRFYYSTNGKKCYAELGAYIGKQVDITEDLLVYEQFCLMSSMGHTTCSHIMQNSVKAVPGWYQVTLDNQTKPIYCDVDVHGRGLTLLLATRPKSCSQPTKPLHETFDLVEYSFLAFYDALAKQSDADYIEYLFEDRSDPNSWSSSTWIAPINITDHNKIQLSSYQGNKLTVEMARQGIGTLYTTKIIGSSFETDVYIGENCSNHIHESSGNMTIYLWMSHPRVFSEETQCAYNPCKNGGKCSIINGTKTCTCATGSSGVICEKRKSIIASNFQENKNTRSPESIELKSFSKRSRLQCMGSCLDMEDCGGFHFKNRETIQEKNCHLFNNDVMNRYKESSHIWDMYIRTPDGTL